MQKLRYCLIPFRGSANSKSRLRPFVESHELDKVVYELLLNTIKVVKECNLIPVILTADSSISDLLTSEGNLVYKDSGKSINNAIFEVLSKLEDDILALVMPDLPGLRKVHLDRIMYLHSIHMNLIVPTHDDGTAIAIMPKSLFSKKMFGKLSSLKIHKQSVKEYKQLAFLEIKELEFDLDSISDWNYWKEEIGIILAHS